MAAPTRRKVFELRGEGQRARDGRPRQEILLHVVPGEIVQLERQPENAHDPNAVAVIWQGADIGFLSRDDAAILAPELDAGRQHLAQIHVLVGGLPDYPNYGAKVAITWDGKKLPDPIPLDAAQMTTRQHKLAAQGRERDSSGTFSGSKGSGCLGIIALMTVGMATIPL